MLLDVESFWVLHIKLFTTGVKLQKKKIKIKWKKILCKQWWARYFVKVTKLQLHGKKSN